MSKMMPWLGRIGPAPWLWGSTPCSPQAMMVCSAMQPFSISDTLTTFLRSSEVSGLPLWSTSSPRTTLSLSTSMAAASAVSVWRCACSMAATSSADLITRSGKNGCGLACTVTPRSRSRSAASRGKSAGTSTAFTP
jgi:hypothetical protein